MLTKHGLSLLTATARFRNVRRASVVSLRPVPRRALSKGVVAAAPMQRRAIHTDTLPPLHSVTYTGNRESGDALAVADDDGGNNCELEEARG